MREVQLDHAIKLISALHPQPTAEAMVEITGLAGKQRPVKRYFTDIGLAADFALDVNDYGYSVFVNANPRNAMAGFEEHVPYVTALALDLQPERTSLPGVYDALVRAGIPPAVTCVSGYGAHMYVFIDPAERTAAKVVWERLVKWTMSDAIYNVNRIMRLTGSKNWKKNPPAWCYLQSLNPERRFDLLHVSRALDAVGAPPPRSARVAGGQPINVDPPEDWFALRQRLSEGVLDIIMTGERNAYSEKQISRSEADWVVVCALVKAGATDNDILWVYGNTPVGQLKFHEAGMRYLTRTIDSARRSATEKPVVKNRGRAPDAPQTFHGRAHERNTY